MPYEMLVGLEVIDDEVYQAYRDAMKPVLATFGGCFGYDFSVAELLKSEGSDAINRVFTIRFPDQDTAVRFFDDPQYQQAKQQYFDRSVREITIIAEYVKAEP